MLSMRKIASVLLVLLTTSCLTIFNSIADDSSHETELNFFTGLFDFSDDKQKAGLFGIEHQKYT